MPTILGSVGVAHPTQDSLGGDSFADFLLGTMYQSEAAVAVADAKFQRNVFGFYIDDTWKLTPKLTLALGLRYELTPPFYDTLGNLFSVYIPYFDNTPNVLPQVKAGIIELPLRRVLRVLPLPRARKF